MTRYDRNGVAEEHWDDPRYDPTALDEPEPREPLTLEQAVHAIAYGCGLADDEVFPDCLVTVYPDRIVVNFNDNPRQQVVIRVELTSS